MVARRLTRANFEIYFFLTVNSIRISHKTLVTPNVSPELYTTCGICVLESTRLLLELGVEAKLEAKLEFQGTDLEHEMLAPCEATFFNLQIGACLAVVQQDVGSASKVLAQIQEVVRVQPDFSSFIVPHLESTATGS